MYTKRKCSQLKKKMCAKRPVSLVYLYFACLSVCFYPINVKTANTIQLNFLGIKINPGKVYSWSTLKNIFRENVDIYKKKFHLNREIRENLKTI